MLPLAAAALLLSLVVAALVRPLARAALPAAATDATTPGRLDAVAGDRARGLISDAEAAEARAEITRRAAADHLADPSPADLPERERKVLILGAMMLVPLLGLGLYALLGTPQEDMAWQEHRATVQARIETERRRMEQDPNAAMAIVLMQMELGDAPAAVDTIRHAVEVYPDNPLVLGSSIEALLELSQGRMGGLARNLLDQADGRLLVSPQLDFFRGYRAAQDGEAERAARIWTDLLADAPPFVPWRFTVEQALADLPEAARQAVAPEGDGRPGEADPPTTMPSDGTVQQNATPTP